MYKVKEGKEHTINGFTQLNTVDLFINVSQLIIEHNITIKDVHNNLHI